jgi:hypothetical protein
MPGKELHFPVECLNQPSTYLFAYLFNFMYIYACLIDIFMTALFPLKQCNISTDGLIT